MSQAPHVVRGARWGLRLGPAAPLEDLLWEALKDPQCGLSMAETAENLAERYKLTRQEVDEVALASQQRAKQAWDACVFQDEVVGVPIKQKGQTVEYRKDEHMRPETTLQVLLGLKPYFKKDGLVTAGNASGIVDGGAVAIGHPLAATGTRITIHLLHALRRRRQRFGLGSACIGGGQGAAVIVEAFPA